MKKGAFFIIAIFCLSCLTWQCKQATQDNGDDRLLARVFNKSLFLSDMEGMLPGDIASEDSSLIIDKFVGNWVREAVMLREAEQNIPNGLDIDQLVEDYRASLLKHNYENVLIDKLLDSVIVDSELEAFYEKNKEQYKLESPIIRCRFIKANTQTPQLNEAKKWWESGKASDIQALVNWSMAHGVVHQLEENEWKKVEEIGAYMPQGMFTVDNFGNRKSFSQKNGEFVYMFELLESVPKSELAPFAYVEDQVRIVILHKRKTELLEEMKDKLYDEAMRLNGITIFQ